MTSFIDALHRLTAASALALLLAACSSTPNEPVAAGYYRVQKGDTLYRIAVNNGQSVNNLARWNNLKDTTAIEVGQVLRVKPPGTGAATSSTSKPAPAKPTATPTPAPAAAPKIALIWPAKGPELKNASTRNNGIDIGGDKGTPILAAAAGKVVYAGEGIRGYGKLLVIKHNQDYLTAYAHNDALLVQEGDQVSQGQKIATMGDSGADRVMLHFELRYKGKAVDPTDSLP
ncbi:murein DD-endopeptidase MepM/ murein hydrolase activator NlpD [Silvimonas terrae]|uniref:Murein DD-endopeptidase MepM/ murein hydrolase activator NlpD n=1 Tax=Silvimonas terrae TaxID=300266 RepID=A0A840RJR8_9NEIS|nr:peptidoglycan DD-metalloendopeptidase family protein [Silvimonas terrae]MBB5192546.1 murein DD-endopeptidase MepM/ murein hydrolase activator NlpD [Silvimonas terrae]